MCKRKFVALLFVTLLFSSLLAFLSQAGHAQSLTNLYLPLVRTSDKFPDGIALLVQKSRPLGGSDLYWASASGNLDYRIINSNSSYENLLVSPLVSPDGQSIVYRETEGIKFIDTLGAPILTVGNEGGRASYHHRGWSEDGSLFWYLGVSSGEHTYPLYTVNLSTFQTSTIALNAYNPELWLRGNLYPIYWLPDNRIAYTEKQQNTLQPYLANADGSSRQRLNVPFPTASIINVLPDGRIVVHDGSNPYVVNADGSQLAYFPLGSYTFSPDGTRAGDAGGVFDLDGNQLAEFEYPPCNTTCYYSTEVLWSPDGNYIAFTRILDYGSGSCAYELYLTKTDGSQTTPTLLSTNYYQYNININFSFSPDSDFFAYTVGVDTRIRNIEEATEIQVAPQDNTVQGGWRSP